MTPPGVERFVARVSGRVQGVGFRYFVCERAEALGVAGSVRNLPAGSVEVEAEGPRDALETLLRELNEGPPHAQVANVSVEWHPPAGVREFRIRTS
ncbi:MAG TPA: acylphosphatase [Candidatus Eisenbacteria bacterium]|nr:acylphosphatase [Candidatus Eisenbacteria bacterium]